MTNMTDISMSVDRFIAGANRRCTHRLATAAIGSTSADDDVYREDGRRDRAVRHR
jgi:hypothetical protein